MEDEINNALESFKSEAMKNAINAFNEGFLLGQRHAEQIFNKEFDKVFKEDK